MNLRTNAGRMWRFAIVFSTMLPVLGTADTISTSFESEPSGNFTIGTSPITATFTGGNAMIVGIGEYYRTGTHSWHVAPGVTAMITFETPAEQVSVWFRDTVNAGPSQVRVIDEEGAVLTTVNGLQSFREVAVTRNEGQTLIDRIEVQNMGNSNDVVVDDFSSVVDFKAFLDLVSLGNVNGNNKTDLGVLLRDSRAGKNKLHVMEGGSGKKIKTVIYGSEQAKGSTTVADSTGDMIPEFGVLLKGSLFAKVKDVVNGTLLGKPNFNSKYDTVAFLSVGNAGGGAGPGPDVAVVGLDRATGKVQAVVKDVASGSLVRRVPFDKAFVPFAAVAVDNVGDSPAMEIAVLGIDASGNVQAQVKDARSGKLINKIQFNKQFTPLFFAAVPNVAGKLKHLAVLGRNASGKIQAQVKRVSNGTLVSNVRFSKNHDPKAFISFADSNGSGGGEIGVVGVNASGVVRAQVKEIANGALVKLIQFSSKYPPLDAIAINGVAGTGRNEIAVLGKNASDQHRLQIKDLLTGNLVKKIPVP